MTPKDSDFSLIDHSEEPSTKRKFGLGWFLGLIASIAVALALSFDQKPPGSINPSDPFWKFLIEFSNASVGLFCGIGLYLVCVRKISRQTVLRHPGYALLLVFGLSWLTTEVSGKLLFAFVGNASASDSANVIVASGFLYVRLLAQMVMVVVCWFGVSKGNWYWRAAFILLAIGGSLTFIYVAATFVDTYGIMRINGQTYAQISRLSALSLMVCTAWVFFAMIVDIAKKRKRDTIHWLGVVTFFWVLIIPPLVSMMAVRFLSFQELFGT